MSSFQTTLVLLGLQQRELLIIGEKITEVPFVESDIYNDNVERKERGTKGRCQRWGDGSVSENGPAAYSNCCIAPANEQKTHKTDIYIWPLTLYSHRCVRFDLTTDLDDCPFSFRWLVPHGIRLKDTRYPSRIFLPLNALVHIPEQYCLYSFTGLGYPSQHKLLPFSY